MKKRKAHKDELARVETRPPRPIEELDKKTLRLVRKALRARKKAYAPYSKFRVGCALVDDKGKIHTGCNVENVSYSLSLHAEEVATGKMVSRGGREIEVLVVATSSEEPVFPCGSCRQFIAEFGGRTRIVATNIRGSVFREKGLFELFPDAFSRKDLC